MGLSLPSDTLFSLGLSVLLDAVLVSLGLSLLSVPLLSGFESFLGSDSFPDSGLASLLVSFASDLTSDSFFGSPFESVLLSNSLLGSVLDSDSFFSSTFASDFFSDSFWSSEPFSGVFSCSSDLGLSSLLDSGFSSFLFWLGGGLGITSGMMTTSGTFFGLCLALIWSSFGKCLSLF